MDLFVPPIKNRELVLEQAKALDTLYCKRLWILLDNYPGQMTIQLHFERAGKYPYTWIIVPLDENGVGAEEDVVAPFQEFPFIAQSLRNRGTMAHAFRLVATRALSDLNMASRVLLGATESRDEVVIDIIINAYLERMNVG